MFLFACLPLYYCFILFFEKNEIEKKKIWFLLLLGMMFSLVFVLIDGLFFTNSRYPQNSIFLNWIYFGLNLFFLPWLICFIMYVVIGKESFENKFSLSYLVLSAFYIIYLPYWQITRNSVLSFYWLFAVPLLILLSIMIIKNAICIIQKSNKNGLSIFTGVISLLVSFLLPSFIISLYFLNKYLLLRVFLEIFFLVATCFSYILNIVFNRSQRVIENNQE